MKRLVLAVCLVGAAAPALADPRDDAMSATLRCTGISDAQSRLACYDAASVRVRGALAAPTPVAGYPPPPYQGPAEPVPQHSFAPANQAAIPPPAAPPGPGKKDAADRFFTGIFGDGGPARPPQTSVQQFGSESLASHGDRAYPSHRDGDTIDAISARLVSYHFTANARLVVALDNGQDWIETSGDSLVGHLAHQALYYSAEISRGAQGSYKMTLTGVARTILMRRLK